MEKKNEWERQALSYFSASTWQNWMKRRPRSPGGASLPPPPPPPNSPLQGRSLSVINCRVDWAHYSFFSDSILKPLTPPRPQNTHTHPPPAPPSLSHGALVSTDQAFNSSIKTYAYRDWTRTWRGEGEKQQRQKKWIKINSSWTLQRTFLKVWFRSCLAGNSVLGEILYESSQHLFLRAEERDGWQARRRLARRCHGNQADLDLSVLMFRYVLCWLFYFHVWSRAGNFLFSFLKKKKLVTQQVLNSFFVCLLLSSVSLFFYFRVFSTVTCPLLSRYWKCVWTYYTFILVELLV